MRLWNVNMLDVLPRQQLISQWRECCCIAKNLATNGTPNHLLVNKILDYPLNHFMNYTLGVIDEMRSRGYKVSKTSLNNYTKNMGEAGIKLKDYGMYSRLPTESIYKEWHDNIYLMICLYNLYEKYLCDGVTVEEFNKIYYKFSKCIDRIILQ